MPKTARLLSGIKSLYCYTIEEAADVTGVSPRTIHNWSKNEPLVVDRARPTLIPGDDLRAILKAQRKGRKIKTDIDEFFCCRCRRARRAAGAFAFCTIVGARAKLEAFCDVCEGIVSKPVAKARIPEIARILDLTITRHDPTL